MKYPLVRYIYFGFITVLAFRTPIGAQTPQVTLEPSFPQTGALKLTSPIVKNGGNLPKEFTGDGESATPPLVWEGGSKDVKAYAVIMHHIDPQGLEKWYWVLYNIPADVHQLPKNVKSIGLLGNNSINRRAGYAPPHSKGPGAKTYILTLYALSDMLKIELPATRINRQVLIKAMQGHVLDSSILKVVYTRPASAFDVSATEQGGVERQRRPRNNSAQ